MIELDHVSAGYDGTDIVRDVSLALPKGELTALIGPNGSGKSTLLKAMAGLLPASGGILYDGVPLCSLKREERAKLVSFLPQQRDVPDIRARTLVEHGRYPHLGFSKKLGEKDRVLVDRAVALTHTEGLMEHPMAALSGGERQRVYLAMLLAQDCGYLLLDEPLTYLDIGAQLETLSLIRELRALGKTVVMAIHDLPQAFSFADSVCLLQRGEAVCFGPPDDPAWPERAGAVFGVRIAASGGDGLFSYTLAGIRGAGMDGKESHNG